MSQYKHLYVLTNHLCQYIITCMCGHRSYVTIQTPEAVEVLRLLLAEAFLHFGMLRCEASSQRGKHNACCKKKKKLMLSRKLTLKMVVAMCWIKSYIKTHYNVTVQSIHFFPTTLKQKKKEEKCCETNHVKLYEFSLPSWSHRHVKPTRSGLSVCNGLSRSSYKMCQLECTEKGCSYHQLQIFSDKQAPQILPI